ncbi:hypothetical protein [Kocuria sabuli]|uniref:hypothetical protein n=1 Tax=Kocuria sabuli TaxID=3071448 RepID=UPI0034D7B04E
MHLRFPSPSHPGTQSPHSSFPSCGPLAQLGPAGSLDLMDHSTQHTDEVLVTIAGSDTESEEVL